MKLPILIAALGLSACAKEVVHVPVAMERPIPAAPAECTKFDHADLEPLPKIDSADTAVTYAGKVGKVHRINRLRYRGVLADKSICRVYINGLQTKSGGGS